MTDYISREKVMDALLNEQYGYLCEDAIKAIPAADVREVKRGRWKPVKPYNNTYMGFECSECGAQFPGQKADDGGKPECPQETVPHRISGRDARRIRKRPLLGGRA